MDFLIKLQQLDRRIIYALVFVSISLPILFPFLLPLEVGPQARAFHEEIERIAPDKVVLFAADFGAATGAENDPQCRAVMEHVMRRGLKFIILSFDPQGPDFGHAMALELSQKYPDYKKYGEKWVNLGFKYTTEETLPSTLQSLANGFQNIVKRDRMGTELSQVHAMKGVVDVKQVGALCEFTGSDTYEYWFRYYAGPKRVKMLTGCTGIIGPSIYPYLDAGQMQGLLNGMKGAAEYEQLMGHWGMGKMQRGGKGMVAQSMGFLLITALIVLGNLSMLAERRLRPATEKPR